MPPTHPNDYLWQEIASLQQYVHTEFDPAMQALTMYLQIWLVAAAAFLVLALVLVLFQAWQHRRAQDVKTTAAGPVQAGRTSLEGTGTSHPGLVLPSLQVRY